MPTAEDSKSSTKQPIELKAIRIHQWLPEWDKIEWRKDRRQAKPAPYFYLLAMPARLLRRLAGIERRSIAGGAPRATDTGIQRYHDADRSTEIAQFIQFGFPWSELSEAKRQQQDFSDLRKPGWLPSAIIVNVPNAGAVRRERTLAPGDSISIADQDGNPTFRLPAAARDTSWHPQGLHPLEIIDGQHRLWAFSEASGSEEIELPVVAFHDLDISWQAYLFWTINIKPKRINPSLAFDLYPLLRSEEWLDKFAGHPIYRETRAQELVEALWSHPRSAYYRWINMLGESGSKTGDQRPMVTQNTWVRALMATYIKAWESTRTKVGGLFGSERSQDEPKLQWTRTQQAAFLVLMWDRVRKAVAETTAPWASSLRNTERPKWAAENDDLAFRSRFSLFTTDPGIRGVLSVTNDLVQINADDFKLSEWEPSNEDTAVNEQAVSNAIEALSELPIAGFLSDLANALSTYDWRTSAAPGLSGEQIRAKGALRGSSGYKQMRVDLVNHLSQQEDKVGESARKLRTLLGYDE